ncbi:hypothetical protein AVEN_152122-1 [Araneus ventricosus]|uniref:Uncharacterized protein n=1 Tax=Araneus ventricosus TaxID=182803 RepID=A0A4Y2IVN2_ARAVE|nr:hypothetical protein AVEN_152122-1 [Araneus ventricosus]
MDKLLRQILVLLCQYGPDIDTNAINDHLLHHNNLRRWKFKEFCATKPAIPESYHLPFACAEHAVLCCLLPSCPAINTGEAYGLTPLQPGQSHVAPLVREEGSLASHWSATPEGRVARR